MMGELEQAQKKVIRYQRKLERIKVDLAKTLINEGYVSVDWAKKNILIK